MRTARRLLGRRSAVVLVLLVVVAGAAVAVAEVEPSGSRPVLRSAWSFGAFAGYEWTGRVTEVRAQLVAPRIESSAADGAASTWIAAEAPGSTGEAPFIQVGVEELHGVPGKPAANVYDAFWDDTRGDFYPVVLFHVAPGDTVAASLELSGGFWEVAIVDLTSGANASFRTRDEARASFDDAEWLQEDDTDPHTQRPSPYPQLTPTRFVSFAVNASAPRPDSLSPQWMSLTSHRFLGPDRTGDSFTVRPMRLSADDEEWLLLGAADATAVEAFAADIDRWTASTPASQMGAQAARYVQATQRFIGGLNALRWPQRVKPLIQKAIDELRQQVILTQPDGLPPPAYIQTWRQAWYDDGDTGATTGTAIRSRLNAPPT